MLLQIDRQIHFTTHNLNIRCVRLLVSLKRILDYRGFGQGVFALLEAVDILIKSL
jgi:hypothetical protein